MQGATIVDLTVNITPVEDYLLPPEARLPSPVNPIPCVLFSCALLMIAIESSINIVFINVVEELISSTDTYSSMFLIFMWRSLFFADLLYYC